MTLKLIESHTLGEHQKSLADYMPNDELWKAKSVEGTAMRNFLLGLSRELLRCEEYIKSLQEQFIPDNTDLFVPGWERAVDIPDNCFTGEGSNSERRRDILVKLASLGVQTVEDFENLAALFGVTVTVIPGQDYIPLPADPKFTIVIEFVAPQGFTYTFPFLLGGDTIAQLECLFNNLKPANCVTLFVQTT